MREIKFRAWDPDEKVMMYDDETAAHKMGYWDGVNTSPISMINTQLKEDSLIPDIYMQYTGLKDKNGIEIYEKDIIILEPDEAKEYFNEPTNLSYGDVCIVEWSNTNLAYYLMPVNEDIEEQQMDYYGAWSGWNWIKVIGNCYENPELLKGAV